ncbi:hypothetical protein F5883DRAFT_513049 [Diaporthe sp. PMI_573]|nr:hypothetical protein F5883DRAFT_513049 [Diaporthaceae sp. PMI_573]
MSVAASESQTTAVTANDLLAYDEKQLVGYLKTQDRGDEFDISSLAGVESLSRGQRRALAQKLSKAASLLPLGIDDLEARLRQVASRHDDSPDPELPESPPDDSLASTPPPLAIQAFEISSRQELARDGGRPVCSVEELSRTLSAPTEGHEAILPWLSDCPDSETGAGELKTVFSRQYMQWWEFRKLQWDSRGLGDSAAGLAAFIEASRRRWEGAGAQAMVSDPSFDETIQRQWQRMPAPRHRPPEGQTFAAYSSAVKARLARHHLTPSLQLRKDPLKQTVRTDWLECLSFEVR